MNNFKILLILLFNSFYYQANHCAQLPLRRETTAKHKCALSDLAKIPHEVTKYLARIDAALLVSIETQLPNHKESVVNKLQTQGQTKQIERLLNIGADPNVADSTGTPALIKTIMVHSYPNAILETLHARHALDINARDAQGNSALIMALKLGKNLIAADLLLWGADKTIQNDAGESYETLASKTFKKAVQQQR